MPRDPKPCEPANMARMTTGAVKWALSVLARADSSSLSESRYSRRSRSVFHSLFQASKTWGSPPQHTKWTSCRSSSAVGDRVSRLQALENFDGGEVVAGLLLERTDADLVLIGDAIVPRVADSRRIVCRNLGFYFSGGRNR